MIEIIFNLLLVGTLAGIIFSMPIAGPISIIVVSKAFQGKERFCLRTGLGSAITESLVVFIVVYGITYLFDFYKPFIPYFLLVGSIFIIFVGIRIMRQKIDLKSLESNNIITDKHKNRGGMRTGIVLNLSNPSLLINWFVASFLTLSFVSSVGMNIGGLDSILNENIESVSEITGSDFEQIEKESAANEKTINKKPSKLVTPLMMSLFFAIGVGLGVYIWLRILTKLIMKYRDKIKTSILDKLIFSLGIVLIFIGTFLGYRAVTFFIS
jgi:threonine/homoserine/homoserine lactone efflux protein